MFTRNGFPYAVASGGQPNGLCFWDRNGVELRSLEYGATGDPYDVAFFRDGTTVLAAQMSPSGGVNVLDLSRPLQSRQWVARLEQCRGLLGDPSRRAEALLAYGQWYAFRGVWDVAAELLGEARRGGAAVSAVELARCYWRAGDGASASREFEKALALAGGDAESTYLSLCLRAAGARDAGAGDRASAAGAAGLARTTAGGSKR